MSEDVKSSFELEHDALRNAIYHSARRLFFERCARFLNFLIIVGGAASVVDVLPAPVRVCVGLLITAVGALQLVFDFGGSARDHGGLQRRYYELIGQIHESGELPEGKRRKLMAELSRISGDEPPVMRALDVIAYNQATDTLMGDAGKSYRIPLTFWESLTAQLIPHNAATFDPPQRAKSID